ncbi:topoisomerase [Pontibacillus halophilus JSM 076056 = DSM 19796]|uniref:Topoisomerase n=1 Tax=Pontibacillus halophilus JSM 076056 = DSM 19796 TaxID=1385510 RepID=A0A0A5GLE2_9BACI|nr:toprim domain-containing protein [Pontibacillus halophilus]KGX92829.1 topoisomerase [Pontibacillus halophilus JSM 076056 = DSM 19796]
MVEKEKVIIVEGRTDKKQILKVLSAKEQIEIVCTNGTLGVERLEELIEGYGLDYKEVFVLVDEDDSGHKLRKQLSYELPHAEHIYVDKSFREVAATPETVLATALVSNHFDVKPIYLSNKGGLYDSN